jgi:hypothetical protein
MSNFPALRFKPVIMQLINMPVAINVSVGLTDGDSLRRLKGGFISFEEGMLATLDDIQYP